MNAKLIVLLIGSILMLTIALTFGYKAKQIVSTYVNNQASAMDRALGKQPAEKPHDQ